MLGYRLKRLGVAEEFGYTYEDFFKKGRNFNRMCFEIVDVVIEAVAFRNTDPPFNAAQNRAFLVKG